MYLKKNFLLAFLFLFCLFQGNFSDPLPQSYVKDSTSNSDPALGVIKNAEFVWNIDLQKEEIQGSVNYTIQAQNGGSESFILDIWNLNVDTDSVQLIWNGESSKPIVLIEDLGDLFKGKMDVTVKNGQQKFPKNDSYYISFNYKLDNTSKTLTWLDTNETMVGESKQIFTQSEAIYARGLFPTQDLQQVKFTWKATVITKDTDPMIILPAKQIDKKINKTLKTTTYTFIQEIPVTASSIAIFGGAFEAQQISTRVRVLTEKGNFRYLLDYFSDVESYLEQIETYLQEDFPFNQIDILMAPDFAPLATAVYPGLIAISPSILPFNVSNTLGKSLVINGLARSWFQFGVTPSLWSCQWLSHGLGTFLERYILQKFFGTENFKQLATLGNDSLFLQVQIDGKDSTWTTLNPVLQEGEDPIRALNTVTKEKGFQFFSYLETYPLGPKLAQDFIRQWYNQNIGFSRTTEEFEAQLNLFVENNTPLAAPILNLINFDSWINGKGMPDGIKEKKLQDRFRTEAADQANEMADLFIILGGYALPQGWRQVLGYDTYEKLMFLNYFLMQVQALNNNPNTERILRTLDAKYNFSGSQEQQIVVTWITLCAYTDYEEFVVQQYEKILSTVGTEEVLLPIYYAFVSTGKKTIAQEQFNKNKLFYDNLVVGQIQRIFQQFE